MSKQAEFEFGNRPGELPLFGPATVAPEPFEVPEFPLEDEALASSPEPEPASAPAPPGRRRSKRPLYFVPCEGPEATGCPRPGCPGDAVRAVVYRASSPPVVRTLCHWCWMAERDAYPLACSVCGVVAEYVLHFSRWWHFSGRNALVDACGDCLRPLPGACMDCTGLDNWLTLCNGEFPDFPGDCTCWRATAERRPLAATVPEVLEILAQLAQAQADALPGQKALFGGAIESES